MSRDPDDYTNERRTAVALERIADTLDAYVDYALAAAKASRGMSDNPQAALAALYEVVDDAIARRAGE